MEKLGFNFWFFAGKGDAEQGTPRRETAGGSESSSLFGPPCRSLPFVVTDDHNNETILTGTIPARNVVQYVQLEPIEQQLLALCHEWAATFIPEPVNLGVFVAANLHRILIATLIDTATTVPQESGNDAKDTRHVSVITKNLYLSKLMDYIKIRRRLASYWEVSFQAFDHSYRLVLPLLEAGCLYWSHISRQNCPVLICHLGLITRIKALKTVLPEALQFCIYYALYHFCEPGEQEQMEIVFDLTGSELCSISLSELTELNSGLSKMIPSRLRQVTFVAPSNFHALITPLFKQFLSPLRLLQYQFITLSECPPLLNETLTLVHTGGEFKRWPFPLSACSPPRDPHKSLYEYIGLSWWLPELDGKRLWFCHPDQCFHMGDVLLSGEEVDNLMLYSALPVTLPPTSPSETTERTEGSSESAAVQTERYIYNRFSSSSASSAVLRHDTRSAMIPALVIQKPDESSSLIPITVRTRRGTSTSSDSILSRPPRRSLEAPAKPTSSMQVFSSEATPLPDMVLSGQEEEQVAAIESEPSSDSLSGGLLSTGAATGGATEYYVPRVTIQDGYSTASGMSYQSSVVFPLRLNNLRSPRHVDDVLEREALRSYGSLVRNHKMTLPSLETEETFCPPAEGFLCCW